jgi:hypothetical protein
MARCKYVLVNSNSLLFTVFNAGEDINTHNDIQVTFDEKSNGGEEDEVDSHLTQESEQRHVFVFANPKSGS